MSAPSDPPVFRFAPSPNGFLHLGHARSAILNHDMARACGGRFLLRHEDLDQERATDAFADAIEADLLWLGLRWDGEARRQHRHFADHRAALERLHGEGLVYPAFATRGEVRAAAAAFEVRERRPWPRDPDGTLLYPDDDRARPEAERRAWIDEGRPHGWRLDMRAALRRIAGPLRFVESGFGPAEPRLAEPARWGDVLLARVDGPASYHLAVTVDDAAQGVTDIVRGRDLLPATAVHRVLQKLLGLPVPRYHHHDLVLGEDGRKLSKSRGDQSIRAVAQAGASPDDVRRLAGL